MPRCAAMPTSGRTLPQRMLHGLAARGVQSAHGDDHEHRTYRCEVRSRRDSNQPRHHPIDSLLPGRAPWLSPLLSAAHLLLRQLGRRGPYGCGRRCGRASVRLATPTRLRGRSNARLAPEHGEQLAARWRMREQVAGGRAGARHPLPARGRLRLLHAPLAPRLYEPARLPHRRGAACSRLPARARGDLPRACQRLPRRVPLAGCGASRSSRAHCNCRRLGGGRAPAISNMSRTRS
mmetsp:Transcript_9228/g.29227  ORF Transcript_9228/g.29227 Transcript_9228/m.29227 type:complete len:235 (-) Transcript_9228:552-1256(-)